MEREPVARDGLTGDLHRYLQQSRERILSCLEDVSDYDARKPMTPTGTNLLGLVKHLVGIELGYLGACVGRPSPIRLPWIDDESIWDDADMWATADETRTYIIELYRTAWQHADESIAQLGPAAPAQVPWWPETRRATTLGSLLVRVLTDTAQHAGHADILRETIDGRTGRDTVDAAARTRHVERVQNAAESYRHPTQSS